MENLTIFSNKQSHGGSNSTFNGSEFSFERVMLQTHALSMLIGWWIFVPMAILSARYFKEIWANDCFGVRTWFAFHRILNVLGVILIALGTSCIFGVRRGHWLGDEPAVRNHVVCGLTTVVIVLFQPLLAVFRCHPESTSRYIFNVSHRFLGLAAWVIAAATIYLSMDLIETDSKRTIRILMIAYFGTMAGLVFLLEQLHGREDGFEKVRVVKNRQLNYNNNNNDVPMRSTRSRNAGGDPLSFQEDPEDFTYRLPTSRCPKNSLYGLLGAALVGLAVAVCYFVAVSDFGT